MSLFTKPNQNNIDNYIVFILLKKLLTPIKQTDAYKLGIINDNGKIIKEPKTDNEINAFTLLDRFILVFKKIAGSQISKLNPFSYVKGMTLNVYNDITIKNNINNRIDIHKITKEFKKMGI